MPTKSIRLSPREEHELTLAAQNENKNISEYIRSRLFSNSNDARMDKDMLEEKIDAVQHQLTTLQDLLLRDRSERKKILVPFLIKSFTKISRAEEIDFEKLYEAQKTS